MNEYLGPDALRVTVSPGRAVYLFSAGDRKQFRRAVQEASSRWAGVSEPIVPVRKGGKVDAAWLQLVEYSRPHRAVNVGCEPQDAALAAAALGLEVIDLAMIDHDLLLRSLHWSALVPQVKDPVAARPNAAVWEAVAAGDPMDPSDGPSLVSPRTWSTDDFAGRAALNGRTVLDFGLAGYAEHTSSDGRNGPTLIWVTKPNSLRDCNWFWNLRALRPRGTFTAPTFLLPVHALDNWTEIQELIANALDRPYGGKPVAVLASVGIGVEELWSIGDRLGLKASDEQQISFPIFGGAESPPPSPRTFNVVDPRQWLAFPRDAGYTQLQKVQRFSEGTPVPLWPESLDRALPRRFNFPMPVTFSGGYLADLPRTRGTALAVHPHAEWQGDALFLLANVSPGSELRLNSPNPTQLLDAVTAGLAASVSTSDKGRLARALAGAKDCRILRDRKVLTTIRDLTTPRARELARALRDLDPDSPERRMLELAASWGGRSERRYRSVDGLTVSNQQARAACEQLVVGGWAERGVEIRCDQCGSNSFQELSGATAQTSCPGCGFAASLGSSRSGVSIHYRLNSLVDKASDQGVVPHLAAMQSLAETRPSTNLLMGADVSWGSDEGAEVDLLGYWGRDVIAGEVKTTAADFTTAQLIRDLELTQRLGAQRHVMAAVEPIPEAVTQRAADQARRLGVALTVVDPDARGVMQPREIATPPA